MIAKKFKGKSGWLITWEGFEAEDNGRCKVINILPFAFSRGRIAFLLRPLFVSQYNDTLCNKFVSGGSIFKDPLFLEAYVHINPELWYGYFPKEYLCARQVKDLWCEESKNDCFESTIHWTELPKFELSPNFDDEISADEALKELKEIRGERQVEYTYSIREAVERRATSNRASHVPAGK